MSKRKNKVFSPNFIFPIIHLVHPPNFALQLFFNLSCVLHSFKGNVKSIGYAKYSIRSRNSLLLRRFVFRMAEASAKRVTGDEPQGTMGRV